MMTSSNGNIFAMAAWWRHQMEIFSALRTLCAGNSPVTGEFPSERPVTRNFDVFFDLRLSKYFLNNGEAGNLRRHRAHYNVIVMLWKVDISNCKYCWMFKQWCVICIRNYSNNLSVINVIPYRITIGKIWVNKCMIKRYQGFSNKTAF